jgi:hypothetical protein
MSPFLIGLLVFVFVVWLASLILFVAWIAKGAPDVINNSILVSDANIGVTGTADADADADADAAAAVAAEAGGGGAAVGGNQLVQTLYIDGVPAVTKTTNLTQTPVIEQRGPMQITSQKPKAEIVQWLHEQKDADNLLAAASEPRKIAGDRRSEFIAEQRARIKPLLDEEARKRRSIISGDGLSQQTPTVEIVGISPDTPFLQFRVRPHSGRQWPNRVFWELDDDSEQQIWKSKSHELPLQPHKHATPTIIETGVRIAEIKGKLLRLKLVDATTFQTISSAFWSAKD